MLHSPVRVGATVIRLVEYKSHDDLKLIMSNCSSNDRENDIDEILQDIQECKHEMAVWSDNCHNTAV